MPIGGSRTSTLPTPNTPPTAAPASRLPKLRDFLRIMVKESASDLVLKANGCPAVRVAGVIRFLGDQPLPAELVRSYVAEVLNERGEREFEETGATDTAVALPGVGRFRCNAFHQCGEQGLVFRAIKSEIPSLKDLNLPVEPLKRLASLKRGLVLATGIAGSGKSTTLATCSRWQAPAGNARLATRNSAFPTWRRRS